MKRNTSRLLTVLMAAVMILAFSVFVNAESELADDYYGKTVILSTNDVHGELEGYAYLAALNAELEARGADVILQTQEIICRGVLMSVIPRAKTLYY